MQETGTGMDTGDYFFLPTEKEIQGSRSYSNTTEANEFPQWQYYVTSSNKVKKRSSSNSDQQLRSPYSSDSRPFCIVMSTGDAAGLQAIYTSGLAVAGCI